MTIRPDHTPQELTVLLDGECVRAIRAGEADYDDWHPEYDNRNSKAAKNARRLCQSCTVREACATFARITGQHGNWGGNYRSPRKTRQDRLAKG
jgi:hypothetical protein